MWHRVTSCDILQKSTSSDVHSRPFRPFLFLPLMTAEECAKLLAVTLNAVVWYHIYITMVLLRSFSRERMSHSLQSWVMTSLSGIRCKRHDTNKRLLEVHIAKFFGSKHPHFTLVGMHFYVLVSPFIWQAMIIYSVELLVAVHKTKFAIRDQRHVSDHLTVRGAW